MSKEIEIKILGISIDDVKTKLLEIDANFVSDTIQKIYTYDLFPISSSFLAIIDTLNANIDNKEYVLAKHRLVALLSDISDILTQKDKKNFLEITNCESISDFIDELSTKMIPPIIFENRFFEIISHYQTNPNKWVRLRESNGKVKIALKQIYNRITVDGIRQHSINDVKEVEIEIDDFDKGKLLLEELGYYHKNYQEKRRISYILAKNIHIDIDLWPHIPPYLEIEADDPKIVYEVLTRLGFKQKDAKILNADDVFTFYGLDMYSYKELKFDN